MHAGTLWSKLLSIRKNGEIHIDLCKGKEKLGAKLCIQEPRPCVRLHNSARIAALINDADRWGSVDFPINSSVSVNKSMILRAEYPKVSTVNNEDVLEYASEVPIVPGPIFPINSETYILADKFPKPPYPKLCLPSDPAFFNDSADWLMDWCTDPEFSTKK